jgi:hypothetical protein
MMHDVCRSGERDYTLLARIILSTLMQNTVYVLHTTYTTTYYHKLYAFNPETLPSGWP